MATARPKKKKIIGGIIIILGIAAQQLADGNTDTVWERAGDSLGEVLRYDEGIATGLYAAAEALVDALDPAALSEMSVDDLETLLTALDTEL